MNGMVDTSSSMEPLLGWVACVVGHHRHSAQLLVLRAQAYVAVKVWPFPHCRSLAPMSNTASLLRRT